MKFIIKYWKKSLKNKLIGGFMVLSFLVLMMGYLGLSHISNLNHEAHLLANDAYEVQNMGLIENQITTLDMLSCEYIVSTHPEKIKHEIEELEETLRLHFEENIHEAELAEDHETAEKLAAIEIETEIFFEEITELEHMVEEGHNEEAIEFLEVTLKSNLLKIEEEMNMLIEHVDENINHQVENVEHEGSLAYTQMITFSLIGFIFAIFLGVLLSNSITRPIKKIEEISKKLAEGDLRVVMDKELLKEEDEIGSLARSCDMMITNLKNMIKKIMVNANNAAATAEELSASSEETNASSEQVSATVQEIAKGGQILSNSASTSKQATDELINSINMIAKSSQESAKNATEANEVAKQGGESAKLAGEKMKSISEVVNSSSTQIQELGIKTQEINKIIEVINSISEQTNLLALNAAIEAARAGEAGKGFAVVADEVRKLAEESKNATKQIEDMVGDIVTTTKTSVEAMQKGTVEVEEGSTVVNQALTSLELITEKIEKVANDVEMISASTQEQIASSEKVKQSITEVSSVAEESAASTEEVSASVEEISGSVQQVATAAQSLAKGSEELKALVNQFKIE